MSRRNAVETTRQDRKRAKRAARRPVHVDKYADKQDASRLAAPGEHYESEERAHERS